jgi:3D (Asp-Asp-Asp) domain-containing protein
MKLLNRINFPLIRKLSILLVIVTVIMAGWEMYLFFWLRTRIHFDHKTIIIRSQPVTVGEILRKQNIPVNPKDIVEPPVTAPMPRRGTIKIIRVTDKTIQQTEEMPFIVRWKEIYTQNLRPVEFQRGTQTTKTSIIRIIYHNGKEFDRVTDKEYFIRKTVYRVVLLDKHNKPKKIYDLSRCKKISMIATAYYPGDPLAWRDGTETCLGLKMQRGIVAIDPSVVPLRTRVFVSGYGYGYAGDTGSAIKKLRIDLGVNNVREEKFFMHRPVTVYLLENANSW